MSEAQTKVKQKIKVKEPSKFKVIYINDDVTTVDFVVGSLVVVFDYSDDIAAEIAMQIDSAGSSVVAVLPYEIAEQKGVEVTVMARDQGFPLAVKIEPEE